MNKCTLIIDGNWLLISRFSVLYNDFKVDLSKEELERSKENLKDMIARSINNILNRLPAIDNIILVSDGGSWRKSLPIPTQLTTKYKENREHKSEIAWDYVFGTLNDLQENFKEAGITTSYGQNIEGDDWCWYWSRKLNNEGISCIIWTSDHDIMQLIQSKNYIFTAWYNERSNKSTLVFPSCLESKEPDPNDFDAFMFMPQQNTPLMESLMKSSNVVEYINPNEIINEKIICGDSGDNIKSVARVIKNGRNYGVGKSEWKKLSNKLNINTIYDLIDKSQKISEEISRIKKFKDNTTAIDVKEMIDYNIKLVWLNEGVIPADIQSKMNEQEYKTIDIDYFRNSYKSIFGNKEPEIKEISDIFDGID